jgi:hypothetical protein
MSGIYPLVTWQVTVPTFTITVTANAVTEVLSVPDGVYWGWRTTGAEAAPGLREATADSLAAVMTATLGTHSELSASTAYYGESANTVPASVPCWTIDDTAADWTIDATSDAAALALFGLETGVLYAALPSTAIARRTAGVWRPKFAPPARLEPVQVAVGSGAMSEYSAATQDRLLFGGRLIWSVVWEYVEAADISRQLLTVADYLPTANRATGDTAGVLDDLLWALANGVIVKLALPPIGTAAVDFREAVMDVGGSLDRNTYATESATAARRYNVTMAFVETQDWDPGTPL